MATKKEETKKAEKTQLKLELAAAPQNPTSDTDANFYIVPVGGEWPYGTRIRYAVDAKPTDESPSVDAPPSGFGQVVIPLTELEVGEHTLYAEAYGEEDGADASLEAFKWEVVPVRGAKTIEAQIEDAVEADLAVETDAEKEDNG